MAWGANAGIQTPYQSLNANVIPPDVYRVAINWQPNRCPLQYDLAKLPINALSFYLNSDNFRPSNPIARVNSAYTSTGTSITVTDSTLFNVGDVLLIESERFLVSAVNTNNTITVSYAFENTTQANHANNTAITLITSATDGAAVDKAAMSRIPSTVQQFCQTVHHAVQVGGSLASTDGAYLGGSTSPFDRDLGMAIQHTMDDFERALYYGKGTVGGISSTLGTQTMKGFQTLLTTNAVTSPTNASAYKPSDFITDGFQAAFNAGGTPDTILVSQDFLGGLSRWGYLQQQVNPGSTELGIATNRFYFPLYGGVKIVPAPQLRSGTAVIFDSKDVRIRLKRPLMVKPRGSRGDAMETDVIMEGALEVENEYRSVWISGVTGFAVQS
jgi:hypothetical protein